jgi:D-inositol-3-phosphate glycosyltransferase
MHGVSSAPSRRLTIAVLCMHTSPLAQPGTGDGGGMNVYVRELATSMARAGAQCEVYTRADSPDAPPTIEVEPGFRVHNVVAGPQTALEKEDLPALVPAFAAAVEAHLRANEIRPDVIHANYWLSGQAGVLLKFRVSAPLVTTFHTLALVKAAGNDPEPEARSLAEREVVACSDLVCASCTVERDQLVHLYGASPSRVIEIPLGVHHAFFSPVPQVLDGNGVKHHLDRSGARHAVGATIGQVQTGPLMVFVGRLQPLKGAELAVQALAELRRPDVTLLIVGGPSGRGGDAELQRLRSLIASRGLQGQVRFVSPQPHYLLSTFYRAADVVLVPSRSESFGLVALEAAACGTPVIASAVGGLTSLVDDGVTGWLMPDRDPAAYADRLRLLFANPGLASAMGEAAAVRARRYAWSATAARVGSAFEELASRSPLPCGAC